MQPESSPHRKNILVILALVGSLCVLVICCVSALAFFSDDSLQVTPVAMASSTVISETPSIIAPSSTPSPEPSPTLTETPTATPSPSPTVTSTNLPPDLATASAVSATRTQLAVDKVATATQKAAFATATREARNATATQVSMDATATVVAEIFRYSQIVVPLMLDYANGMDLVSTISGEIAVDPYLLYDNDWRARALIALVLLEDAGDKLGSVSNVPQAMRGVNSWLVKVKQETHTMVNNYMRGVDNLSVTYLERAVNNVNTINQYIENARRELDKVLEQ